MPGVTCEEKGQYARTTSFPPSSASFNWLRRNEHLCSPFLLQHAGTSGMAVSAANTGRREPVLNNTISSAERIRRKASSGYSKTNSGSKRAVLSEPFPSVDAER